MGDKKQIKEIQKAYNSYLDIFSNCLHRPHTPSELTNKAKTKKETISMQSFSGEILPRLKDLSLVLEIPRTKKNIPLLKELFNITWKDKRTINYLFLTPKTSKIKIIFKKFMGDFGEYLKEKELVEKIIEALIFKLQVYELLSKNFEGLLKLEDKTLKVEDFLVPVHKHSKKDGKPILLNKEEIRKYNFFQIIYAEKEGKSIPLKQIFKKDADKKKISIMRLNYELTKKITQTLLINKEDIFYVPLSINLFSTLNTIGGLVILLGQYTNMQININQDILEGKFRNSID